MKSILSAFCVLVAAIIFAGCGLLKKDPNTEVQDFVNEFAKSLSEPDSIILLRFSTVQSSDAVLAGIHVLQNRDQGPVKCAAFFDSDIITFENAGVRVKIPITFTLDSLTDRRVDDSLVLWLDRKGETFSIVKFEGESFYNSYITLTNSVEFEMNQHAVLADRLSYYEKANQLQKTYDSVIWYVNYSGKSYFYVVKGEWVNYFLDNEKAKPDNILMGLVDENGEVIVPVEYDLVGTLGISAEDIVEVRKDGRVGYYQISNRKKIVPTDYQWIIPASKESGQILVRKDTTYGWLDDSYQFHPGFQNAESKRYVMNFDFLPEDLTISEETHTMCEVPATEYAASGIVMPPSYLTSFGIFKEVMAGFTIGEVQNMGYREYVTTKSSFMENVADKISTLVTTFTERYLEGREEFYTHKELTFLNDKRESVGSIALSTTGEVSFKKIDSVLLEVKIIPNGEEGEGYYAASFYKYFTLEIDGNVSEVKSNRIYVFTEKVKMDSSYLIGDFSDFDESTERWVKSNFRSTETIQIMRDEILAAYGYQFPDANSVRNYKGRKWYQPRYSSYSEFFENMTEIDKHNLVFLERIVGTLDPSYSASL